MQKSSLPIYSSRLVERMLLYAILSCVCAVTLLMWLSGSYSLLTERDLSSVSIALGRLLGLVAQLLLLLQVLLVARIPWIERLFGYDKMNRLHRYVGGVAIVCILLHPLLLAFGHADIYSVPIHEQLGEFIVHWPYVGYAFLAVLCYVLIALTSWHIVRYHVRYESWYAVHFLTYAALILGFLHQPTLGTMHASWPLVTFWIGLLVCTVGLFLLYRWLYPLYLTRKHRWTVSRIVHESPDVVSVYISGRNVNDYIYRAGQFTTWRFHHGDLFSQIKTGSLFPHPFSFSHAQNGTDVRISVKALGDFTKQIPQLPIGTKVTVAQPLGRFTLPDSLFSQPKPIVLIAGGIGITPLRSIAEEAHQLGLTVTLLYGAKTRHDFALVEECRALVTKLVCFASNEDLASEAYNNGIIDAESILREVADIASAEIFVCGPAGMMMSIVNQLYALGAPKERVHFERFGY